MLYDARFVFINGESLRAEGSKAKALRRLADRRGLSAAEVARLGPDALRCLAQWAEAGWLHAATAAAVPGKAASARNAKDSR
ncbi:MAG: winged helix domain-containing protein [Rubrivivax sp.]